MTKKTDKPADPKPAIIESTPSELWNQHWNVRRRMLEARRLLRGTQLWKQFSLQRDFDAFSIHPLARGVEEVLTTVGVISSFAVTKWHKSGNTTVVEGIVQFTDVDHGETLEYPTVGEGIDESDKGLGKASSYARKLGLVNALNLGIGVDNEATQQQAQPGAQAGPTMSGAPQQGTKTPDDYIRPAPNGSSGANGAATKMYTLQQAGVKARSVLGSGMLSNCWAIIQNTGSVQALDDWESLNLDMLKEFSADDPVIAGQLKKIADSKRHTLQEKGL